MLSGTEIWTPVSADSHLDLKIAQKGIRGIQRWAPHPQAHWHVQLFRVFFLFMTLLLLNKCDSRFFLLFNGAFYGNDVKPFVNMSRGLWDLWEDSQLRCEDSYCLLHIHNNRTFTSFNYRRTNMTGGKLFIHHIHDQGSLYARWGGMTTAPYTHCTVRPSCFCNSTLPVNNTGEMAHKHFTVGLCRHWHISCVCVWCLSVTLFLHALLPLVVRRWPSEVLFFPEFSASVCVRLFCHWGEMRDCLAVLSFLFQVYDFTGTDRRLTFLGGHLSLQLMWFGRRRRRGSDSLTA